MKPVLPLCVGLLLLTFPAFALAPYLLPLWIPATVLLNCFLRAKRVMTRSLSQLAVECGEPLGMTRVKE